MFRFKLIILFFTVVTPISEAWAFKLESPLKWCKVTSEFGMREHPIDGEYSFHDGIDLKAKAGTPYRSPGDGVVMRAYNIGGHCGNIIEIKHQIKNKGTICTLSCHMQGFAKGIRRGSKVKQGQVVARVGATGRVTGPHSHLMVKTECGPSGSKVNPKNFFKNLCGYVEKIEKTVRSVNPAAEKKKATSEEGEH